MKDFFEDLQHNLILDKDKSDMFQISQKVPVGVKWSIEAIFGQNYAIQYLRIGSKDFFETLHEN